MKSVHASCRKEPVRFDSFRFRTFSKTHRFGSARFGQYVSRFDAVRPALFGRAVARSRTKFASFPRPVPAGFRIKRFGSVQFGGFRFGFLFLPGKGKLWGAKGSSSKRSAFV